MKMQIELPINVLKTALSGLSKVISRSSALPVLRCVRLERDHSDQVTLEVTDLDHSATYRVAGKYPGTPGNLLVPWDSFAKVIKSTKDRAAFSLEGDTTLIVHSFVGTIGFEEPVSVPQRDEWPAVPRAQQAVLVENSNFKTAVREALVCASTDPGRYILNGVYLDVTDKGDYVVATDGRHLYSANSFNFALDTGFVLPAHKFLGWSGFAEDGDWMLKVQPVSPAKDRSWAEIQSEHWTFGTKLVEGSYPNWRQVVPNSPEELTRVRFGTEAIRMLLEAVPRMPTAVQDTPITLSTAGGSLHVRSRPNENIPWTQLAVPDTAVEGNATVVTLNRNYFLKALRMGFVEMELRGSLTAIVFRTAGKAMVVMPLTSPRPAQIPPAPDISPLTQTNTGASSESGTEIATNTERNITMTETTIHASDRTNRLEQPEESSLKTALTHLEKLRAGLKELQGETSQSIALLKAAEKDQKSAERDLQSVRATLRSLQRVEI